MENFISLNIKHLRSENNLDQLMLGDIIGVTRDVGRSYERGTAVPKLETLQLICKHFNITLDDFVNRNLRTLHIEKIWSENASAVKEPGALLGNLEPLQKTIDTQEKYIKMLEAEIKRLKGNQEYNSKTA
jgi:DNA-binding XRE family transcriptional regulator